MKRVAVVAALFAVVAAGCSASTVRETTVGGIVGVGAPRHAAVASHTTPAQRRREAAAVARRILRETPHIRGEKRTSDLPKNLRQANQTIGVGNLLTRKRYWTVALTAHQTYRRLKAAHVRHLHLSGWGDVRPGEAQLYYDAKALPRTMSEADEFIEIHGHGSRTIVAAFAQVVPHPVRLAAEQMTVSDVSGTLRRTTYHYGRHQHQTTKTYPLTTPQATQIARLFNRLPAAPPGSCFSGLQSEADRVTLSAGGVSWVLNYPADCAGVDVQRAGQQMPELDTTVPFRNLLDTTKGTTPTPASARHQQAVALANRILGRSPQIAGESLTTTIPKNLSQPWSRPQARNLVTRARYWTIQRSQREVYRRLKAATVKHLDLDGGGAMAAGGAGELSYDALDLPKTVEQADDLIEVRQQSDGSSVIAAFAQVVAYPVRPAAEHITGAGVRGTLRRIRMEPGSRTRRGRPTTVTLTSKQAHAVVRLVNRMPAEPPWTCSGPFPSATFRIVLRSSGTTWQLHYPGPCDVLHVKANGRLMRALLPKAAFWHQLNSYVRSDS
jgi:hypothetical protein